MSQVKHPTGDPFMQEFKDVWLATNAQPDPCTGLGRMMLSAIMTQQGPSATLMGTVAYPGSQGQAIATAQSLGPNISPAQLNQIQENPLNYLWSAPKPNDDYAYIDFCSGAYLADSA